MFDDVVEPADVVRDVPTGAVDRFEEPVVEPQDVGTLAVMFAPGSSDEPVAIGRNAVVTKPTLFVERDTVGVKSTDRVRFRGDVWDVDGDPQQWPGGRAVIALVRQKG